MVWAQVCSSVLPLHVQNVAFLAGHFTTAGSSQAPAASQPRSRKKHCWPLLQSASDLHEQRSVLLQRSRMIPAHGLPQSVRPSQPHMGRFTAHSCDQVGTRHAPSRPRASHPGFTKKQTRPSVQSLSLAHGAPSERLALECVEADALACALASGAGLLPEPASGAGSERGRQAIAETTTTAKISDDRRTLRATRRPRGARRRRGRR